MDSIRFPADGEGGAILGSEYCSGYIDVVGQWNTGFYCPTSGENTNVFCCGTETHKYCCTKKDQMVKEEMEGVTVIIGFLVGASSAIILLTIISCICCPWCPNYRRKHVEKNEGFRGCDGGRKYGTLGREPRNLPTYHLLPRSSYILIPQDTPDLLSETRMQSNSGVHPLTQSMMKVNMVERGDKQHQDGEEDNDIYQSTKF